MRHLGLVEPTKDVVHKITDFYDHHAEARTLNRKWKSRAHKHVKKAKKRGRIRASAVFSPVTLGATLLQAGLQTIGLMDAPEAEEEDVPAPKDAAPATRGTEKGKRRASRNKGDKKAASADIKESDISDAQAKILAASCAKGSKSAAVTAVAGKAKPFKAVSIADHKKSSPGATVL